MLSEPFDLNICLDVQSPILYLHHTLVCVVSTSLGKKLHKKSYTWVEFSTGQNYIESHLCLILPSIPAALLSVSLRHYTHPSAFRTTYCSSISSSPTRANGSRPRTWCVK